MLARRDAIGTDLNPLAVLLATRKLAPCDAAHDEKLLAAAARVRERADERRTKKAGAHKRYGAEDVEAFDPHVLLELDSVRDAIERETDGIVRDDLRVALSAILTKVSRRKADTSLESAPKRIAAGYTAKLFVRKTEELVARRRAFAEKMPTPRPRVLVFVDDARELVKVRDGEAGALVTSPPYVGTYDYAAHHALRMRWLGLHSRRLEQNEMGARRDFGRGGPRAAQEWESQLGAALRAMHRVLAARARAAFVIADSELGGRAVRADATFATLAPRHGFSVVARASQPRPHFHDHRAFYGAPRLEHAISARTRVKKPRMPRIVFIGLEGETAEADVPQGAALVDLCDTYNAPIPFSCRSASCGTCRLVVLEGANLLAPAEDDEIQVLDAFGQGPPDRRLACQAKLVAGPGLVRVRAARDDE